VVDKPSEVDETSWAHISQSTSNIADASRFSVLVRSDGHGATVLEAPVPQR
jgi:predicted thioredoxin/glutaredoxin